MRKLIVNLYDNECFTVSFDENIEECIARAKASYEEDVKTYERNLVEVPNMADHWKKELSRCKNVLAAGFEAITFDEYEKRQREKWLSKEPKEITREEYDYALNVLPPKEWIQNDRYSMFFIGECTTMTFYGQYLYDKVSGKYFYALTDICDRSTWLDKMLNL